MENNIGDEGGKAIGEALKVNTSLTKIYLDSNNIGAEGGKAIGEGIESEYLVEPYSLVTSDTSPITYHTTTHIILELLLFFIILLSSGWVVKKI